MLTVGGDLYAVGGSKFIGAVSSIEKFNAEKNAWEEFGEMSGSRSEFCTMALNDKEIIVIGGYDDLGNSNITEKFNLETKTWTALSPLPIGRDYHSCIWHKDEIVVAGGWIPNTLNNLTDVVPTGSIHIYDHVNDSWSEMKGMQESRTLFGLVSLNGILTAIGGWTGLYSDTIESFNEDLQSWEFDAAVLSQKKGAFAVVDAADYFADVECPERV